MPGVTVCQSCSVVRVLRVLCVLRALRVLRGVEQQILGVVSWVVQLLSRMATELVVEREGREDTHEHNDDAPDCPSPI